MVSGAGKTSPCFGVWRFGFGEDRGADSSAVVDDGADRPGGHNHLAPLRVHPEEDLVPLRPEPPEQDHGPDALHTDVPAAHDKLFPQQWRMSTCPSADTCPVFP